MSLAIKLTAASLAVLAGGAIGYLYLPHIKPDKISAKPLVEQPVFVVASAAKSEPAQPPSKALAAAPTGGNPGSLVTLAATMKATSATFAPPEARLAHSANSEASEACARGLVALASGDLAAARSWLERAADLGDARALIALGDAYNPAMLARLGVLGAPGDAERARSYYNRALSSGLDAARGRIASLTTTQN